MEAMASYKATALKSSSCTIKMTTTRVAEDQEQGKGARGKRVRDGPARKKGEAPKGPTQGG